MTDGLVRLIFCAHGAYNQIYHSLLIGLSSSVTSHHHHQLERKLPAYDTICPGISCPPLPLVKFVKGPSRQRDKFVKFRSVFARSSVHPFITPFRSQQQQQQQQPPTSPWHKIERLSPKLAILYHSELFHQNVSL